MPFTPPPPPPTSIRVLPEQREFFQVRSSVDVKGENRGSSLVRVSPESEGRDRHSTSKEIDEGAAFSKVQVFERRRVTNTTESKDETDVENDDTAQRLPKRSIDQRLLTVTVRLLPSPTRVMTRYTHSLFLPSPSPLLPVKSVLVLLHPLKHSCPRQPKRGVKRRTHQNPQHHYNALLQAPSHLTPTILPLL